MIREAGGRSPATGTTPLTSVMARFRNTVCLSLNDGALHGLPHPTVLANGDLLSIDLALSVSTAGVVTAQSPSLPEHPGWEGSARTHHRTEPVTGGAGSGCLEHSAGLASTGVAGLQGFLVRPVRGIALRDIAVVVRGLVDDQRGAVVIEEILLGHAVGGDGE